LAMAEIESDDVLEAKMVCGELMAASC
jgi:hypothetical protein